MEESQIEEIENKPNKFWKIGKYALIVFGFLFVIGVVLAYVFEGDIKKYALAEINKNLKAKVKVEEKNISFSLFKKFPRASLTFSDFLIEDENQKDTLLFAESISLEFGFGAIFSGNYSVKEIGITNSSVNLRVDEKGNGNYNIVKENIDTTAVNEEFQFNLDEVNFKNVVLNYVDEKTKFKANVVLEKTKFSGDFSDKNSKLNIDSRHYIKNISQDSNVFFQSKNGKLLVENGNFSKDKITLKKGSVSIEEMSVDFDGEYTYKSGKFDFNTTASNVEISDVFSLLPNEISQKLQEYSTKGKINGTLSFQKNKWNPPTIKSTFAVANGTLEENSSGVELTELVLEGNYDLTPKTQKLEITKLTGNLAGGNFSGNGKMIGKNQATILSNFQGNFDLKELGNFLNLENLEESNGKFSVNNSFRGTISSDNKNMVISEFNGKASLENATIKLKNKPEKFTNLSGDINFNRFKSNATFTGNYGASDLSISSQFSNVIPYLFYNKNLTANVYFQSKSLNLSKLLESNSDAKNSAENDTVGVQFPKRMFTTISTKIQTLVFGKHEYKNVSGNVKIIPSKIELPNIKMQANDGNYILNGTLTQTNKGFTLNSKIIIGQIEIKDLFKRYEDFGQEVLVNKHLKGKANAIVIIKATYDKFMEMDINSLDVTTELSIIKGELIKFELFDEIAEYLKSNIIARNMLRVDDLAKKLKHLVFEELTNKISIKNSVITIPDMVIKSNAMDIGIYGTQTFDGKINYGINFRLSDVMAKKKESEFGYIVDDGTGMRIFLLMTGTIDNPIFKLDKTGRKTYSKQKREAEKNTLKNILKDEFGFFKNDTSLKTIPEKDKPKSKIEIEWGEEETTSTEKTSKKVEDIKDKTPKKKSWLDRMKKKEEKPKKKVGFEVE